LDYEDFLRQRGLTQWEPTDPRRAELVRRRPATADAVAQWALDMQRWEQNGRSGPIGQSGRKVKSKSSEVSTMSTSSIKSTQTIPSIPEIAANGMLVLINVAATLLDRQIASLAKLFIEEGGFTERLYKVRKASRSTYENG
jgi:four helix bundle suffix protein